MASKYDGRAKSLAASRAALNWAMRLEALDERDAALVIMVMEHFEEKQAKRDGAPRTTSPAPH
jgi:hypothetical protein